MRPSPFSYPDFRRQVSILVAILGSIIVNTLSNFFPINGVNIATLSNTRFVSLQITPAGYAFAIWGLIYMGLIAFGVYQLQPNQRQNLSLQRSGYLLVFSCLAQCVWIYFFLSRLFPLSVVAMAGILLPLMGLYLRLGIGRQRVSRKEHWCLHVPISIYLGWITVATVVNVATALYSLNWDGWGIPPSVWTAMMMIVSAAIATAVTFRGRDTAFVLVIVWALVAIAIRQITTPLIAGTGLVLAIALILLSLGNTFNHHHS